MTYTSEDVSLDAAGEWTFTDWKRLSNSERRDSNISPMKTFMTLLLEDTVTDVHGIHAQVDGTGMVGRIMSHDVRCHVGYDDIRLSTEPAEELQHGAVLGDVTDEGLDALQRFDVPEVDTDDLSIGPCAFLCHLQPTTGTGTEVDDGIAGLENTETVVDLDEFEGCPGAIVQLLGEFVVVLVPPLRHPTVVQVCHGMLLSVPLIY